MLVSITEAVADSLYAEFGDSVKIYAEPIAQDTREPCFFVLLLNSTIKQVLDKRYFMANQLCIQYFPSDKIDPNLEISGIIERLMTTLDDISVDGNIIHGKNIHTETVDNVLNFFVNYDLYVYREKTQADSMERITITQALKGV